MANRFFENFPTVNYDGVKLRNIILKSKIISDVLGKVQVMHPYVINDGERADTIAFDYYGDSELYWLVYMSNSIVDPYYDWPMNQAEFQAYIIKKYGSIETAMTTVRYWSRPVTNYYMTPETKNLLPPEDLMGWATPIYQYDYENELNENRRNIVLIDSAYAPQIVSEIAKIYG